MCQEKQEQNVSTAEARRETRSMKSARSTNLSVSRRFSLGVCLVPLGVLGVLAVQFNRRLGGSELLGKVGGLADVGGGCQREQPRLLRLWKIETRYECVKGIA